MYMMQPRSSGNQTTNVANAPTLQNQDMNYTGVIASQNRVVSPEILAYQGEFKRAFGHVASSFSCESSNTPDNPFFQDIQQYKKNDENINQTVTGLLDKTLAPHERRAYYSAINYFNYEFSNNRQDEKRALMLFKTAIEFQLRNNSTITLTDLSILKAIDIENKYIPNAISKGLTNEFLQPNDSLSFGKLDAFPSGGVKKDTLIWIINSRLIAIRSEELEQTRHIKRVMDIKNIIN